MTWQQCRWRGGKNRMTVKCDKFITIPTNWALGPSLGNRGLVKVFLQLWFWRNKTFRKRERQTLFYNWFENPSKWCPSWRKNWRRNGTTKVGTTSKSFFFKQIQNNLLLALTAIFDSADPLNEGKISMKEYLQVCLKNGIEVKWKKRNPKLILTDIHQNGYQER